MSGFDLLRCSDERPCCCGRSHGAQLYRGNSKPITLALNPPIASRDAVMGMHPQVRTRYIASIYAKRKGLIGKEREAYLNKQESRRMSKLTADTITDEQIRKLGGPGCDRSIRRLCKIALNDAPTYLRASVVRDARRRCAEILNQRANTKGPTK